MYNSANAIFGQILYQSRLSKYSHINYICSVLSIRLFLVFVSNLAFALVISLKNISLKKQLTHPLYRCINTQDGENMEE